MVDATQYPIEVRPLPSEDGGGWLATFADLAGCIGDGETPEAAVMDSHAAANAWLAVAEEAGDPMLTPACGGESGKFMARVPKSLHARYASRACTEGVSMNTGWSLCSQTVPSGVLGDAWMEAVSSIRGFCSFTAD